MDQANLASWHVIATSLGIIAVSDGRSYMTLYLSHNLLMTWVFIPYRFNGVAAVQTLLCRPTSISDNPYCSQWLSHSAHLLFYSSTFSISQAAGYASRMFIQNPVRLVVWSTSQSVPYIECAQKSSYSILIWSTSAMILVAMLNHHLLILVSTVYHNMVP